MRLKQDLILLTTLEKKSLSSSQHYEGRFLDERTMQWQSQTLQASLIGCFLSGAEPGYTVHLLARASKLRNGKAAPCPLASGLVPRLAGCSYGIVQPPMLRPVTSPVLAEHGRLPSGCRQIVAP